MAFSRNEHVLIFRRECPTALKIPGWYLNAAASVAFRRRYYGRDPLYFILNWRCGTRIFWGDKRSSEQSGANTMRANAMKKSLLGTAGLIALGMAAPASAADLPVSTYTKAPPPMVAPVYDWSGFYIGVNGGWGQNRDHRGDVTTGVDFGSHDANGGTAGGQFGYRWQTGPFVFGLEAQGNWADFRGSAPSLAAPAVFTERSRLDAFGLFTGQIGYAWNNALLYAKGGAAVTDTNYDVLAAGAIASSTGDTTNWGATVGAGVEYGFAPNWSVAVEYDHIFQTSRNLTFTTPAGVALADSFRTGGDTDLVTARINWRFGGPVIPKY
jgi:outer membrane immunogenic protein